MRCWSVAVVALVLASAACSSSSSSSPSSNPEAVAMCNKVVDALCSAFERCAFSKKADCVTGVSSSLNCSKAVTATSNAQPCIDTLATVDCTALGTATSPTLPAVCSKVILVSASVAAPAEHTGPSGEVTPHLHPLAAPVDDHER